MESLLAACAFFVILHLGVAGSPLRGRLVAVLGENGFAGLFSVATFGALWWMAMAYNQALLVDNPTLWIAPIGLLHSATLLNLVAFLFLVMGLTTPNPTIVRGEGMLSEASAAPRGILTITRHPFLWGVTLWGLTHIAVNGDGPSLLLFGTLVLVAVLGTWSIDRKRAAAAGADWERFAAQTSNIPFGRAVTGGKVDWAGLGWWRIGLAILVYGAVLWLHPILFKVSPLPGVL